MTSVLTLDFLQVDNRPIPAEYMPEWCDGVMSPVSDGSTNLFGAQVGARGGATCLMGWDFCPENVYRWWFNEFWGSEILTLPVFNLVIADPEGLGSAYLPERYINKRISTFNYALVHRIDRSNARRRDWDLFSRRRPFLEGSTTIAISKIGAIPPL